MLHSHDFDFERLLDSGNKPRLHPNGFIQFDLGGFRRLHVWPKEPIRPGIGEAPIHDHVFSFESRLLLGKLTNVKYELIEDSAGDYELYGVICYAVRKADAPLERLNDKYYRLHAVEKTKMTAPSRYAFPAYSFHESRSEGLSLSIIEMTPPDQSRPARVVVRRGQAPLPVFQRDGGPVEQGHLWGEIMAACMGVRLLGHHVYA
jgi:hypothetical protein